MRLYLDANFVVYCIQGGPPLKQYCLQRLREVGVDPSGDLVASRLTRVEVLVKPMRERNEARTQRFEGFFAGHDITLLDISNAVVERALDVRVHSNLKLLDALHVATAIEANATRFLTGDKDIAALGRLEAVLFELIPVA